jgi:hypothetical protein
MFLDGPGGSGKSRVVTELLRYAQDYTSRLGLVFNLRTIVVTALSGVAATSIGGETLHSAASFFRNIADDDHTWANVRLLIIDEVSFMNVDQVGTLEKKLQALLHCWNHSFGGIRILFCGDFRQLEPVTGTPLSSPALGDKQWVNCINCYVQLSGLHRFQEDPEWGAILSRIRNGNPTSQDIVAINKCVIQDPITYARRPIPPSASYCVYHNSDRTAINAGIFSSILGEHWRTSTLPPTHLLAITAGLMQRVQQKSSVPLQEQDRLYIYENCGDHLVTSGSGKGNRGHFLDPLLKLYFHVPLMLVSNDDVPNGHANGTRVLLEAVVLKPNVTTNTISIDGFQCPSVDANLVHHLVCSLDGDPTKIFRISPRTITCRVKIPVPSQFASACKHLPTSISMVQLPILVNNATTGHKLQGQNKSILVVSVWSKRNNWNYVALSRVSTRSGLYLVKPLPYNTDFSISADLTTMLTTLSRVAPAPLHWTLHSEQQILISRFLHTINVLNH